MYVYVYVYMQFYVHAYVCVYVDIQNKFMCIYTYNLYIHIRMCCYLYLSDGLGPETQNIHHVRRGPSVSYECTLHRAVCVRMYVRMHVRTYVNKYSTALYCTVQYGAAEQSKVESSRAE